MQSGVKSTNISNQIDVPLSLIGNDEQGTGIVPFETLSKALFGTGYLADQLAAVVLATKAAVIREDFAALDTEAYKFAEGTIGIAWGGTQKGVYKKVGSTWRFLSSLPQDIAEGAAANARTERVLAAAARQGAEAARDLAAGYVSAAVSQGNVPIYSTVAGMGGLSIPQGIISIRVNGFNAAGDNGGGLYARVASQPTGEYSGLAFRTNDRFMPDGSTSSADGGWWAWREKFSMRGICQRLAARLSNGTRVVIACFGDSTTDGNNTSNWLANPRDADLEAIGNADHVYDAPNAWPMRLAWALSGHYDNENYKIMNCGYSGRKMRDGWAVRNFLRAVVNNCLQFAGGLPDAVIIAFGLNDMLDSDNLPETWLDDYISETRKLCRLAMAYGIVPILQTCDPCWRSDRLGYDSWKAIEMVDAAKVALAEELGIYLMDTGGDIKRWLNSNKERHNYFENQSDALHGGDVWCAFKGTAVARHFMRNYVTRLAGQGPQRVSAHSAEAKCSLGQESIYQMVQSQDGACYTSGSSDGPGNLAPAGNAMDVWIWNEDPDAELFYFGVANENFEKASLATRYRLRHSIWDLPNMAVYQQRTPSNIGFAGTGRGRVCDVPYRVGKLPFGMSRVRYHTNDNPYYFVGHYQIHSTADWQISNSFGQSAGYASRVEVDALKGRGRYVRELNRAEVTGFQMELIPQALDMSNVIGMCNNDITELYVRAVLPVSTGIILGWTPCYADRANPAYRNDVTFLFLYRKDALNVGLYHGSRISGAISFDQLGPDGAIAQAVDSDGALKFLIRHSRPGDIARVQVYESWDYPASAKIEWVSAEGGVVVPSFGYTIGGVLMRNDNVATGYLNFKLLDLFGAQETALPGKPTPTLVAPVA